LAVVITALSPPAASGSPTNRTGSIGKDLTARVCSPGRRGTPTTRGGPSTVSHTVRVGAPSTSQSCSPRHTLGLCQQSEDRTTPVRGAWQICSLG
jgi:hypothetical protein